MHFCGSSGFEDTEMRTLLTLLFQLLSASFCLAQENSFDEAVSKLSQAPMAVKIYSQTLSFLWPKGFTLGTRTEKGGAFSQVFTVTGESDENWKQRILVTGAQNVSVKEKEPVKLVSNLLKVSYRSGCPTTFSVTDVGEMKIDTGQSAFVFMVGCGIMIPVEKSEKEKMLAMAVVIQGRADVYSMVWIEKSDTDVVPPLAWPVWRARLDSLLPIQIF